MLNLPVSRKVIFGQDNSHDLYTATNANAQKNFKVISMLKP